MAQRKTQYGLVYGIRKEVCLVALVFVTQLVVLGFPSPKPLRADDGSLTQQVFRPLSLPDREKLPLVSFSPVTIEGQIVGGLAVYNDVTTERPVDCVELFDTEGELVAVVWFDQFGIERIAVDRGLLGDQDELEGVFVLIVDGDLI